MKRQSLVAKAARKFKCTTDSKHKLPVAPNLLEQDFNATAPNQKWAGDITYLATSEGWMYLAVVIDLYSRQVVGWSMNTRMTATLVCDALSMALFRSYGQIWCTDSRAMSCWFSSVSRMPSWNFTPLITSASNLNPLSLRQFDSAVFINLKAIASVVFRLPQLFVLLVLSLTVANIDSIGFVVRTCAQCSAGKS